MIMPALSNNSHELFHSNLWKWLIENNQSFVKVFFADFDIKKFKSVSREKKHMDLVIEDTDGNKYVIENKFKSAPDEKQLLRYKEKIDKNNKTNRYLLTYIIDFNFSVNGWDSLEYSQISKRIRNEIKKQNNNKVIKKYRSILIEYCDYIDLIINNIKNIKYLNNNIYYCHGTTPKEVLEDDMKVIYMKMKLERLKEYINKDIKKTNIEKELNKKGLILNILTGFNNGKTTLTYRVQKKGWIEQGKHTAIEIQIEASQYRYMARLIDKNEKKTYKDAFKIFAGTKFFNDKYNKKTKNLIHGRISSMKDISCKYIGRKNRTIGIYQYYDLEKKISYATLSERIIEDLKYINKILVNKKIKNFINE